MADLIKKIKIKKQDGTFTDYIPIGAEASNIDVDGESVDIKLNKKPYYYNTITDMKADSKLKIGDTVITLGYYTLNDGGGAEYKIVGGTHTDEGGNYHRITNGLFAHLLLKDTTNIKQFGIKGDRTETHDQLNHVFYSLENTNSTLLIPAGQYSIHNTCRFSNIKIKGIGEAIFIAEEDFSANGMFATHNDIELDNLIFDANNIAKQITLDSTDTNYEKITNCVFKNTALNSQNVGNYPTNSALFLPAKDTIVENCKIINNRSHGINLKAHAENSTVVIKDTECSGNGTVSDLSATLSAIGICQNSGYSLGSLYRSVQIINCICDNNGASGIATHSCVNTMITNCVTKNNREHGMCFMDGYNGIISNCILENNGAFGIRIQGDYNTNNEHTGWFRAIISNNIFTKRGVELGNIAYKCIISNNIFQNSIPTEYYIGVQINRDYDYWQRCDNLEIVGNIFHDYTYNHAIVSKVGFLPGSVHLDNLIDGVQTNAYSNSLAWYKPMQNLATSNIKYDTELSNNFITDYKDFSGWQLVSGTTVDSDGVVHQGNNTMVMYKNFEVPTNSFKYITILSKLTHVDHIPNTTASTEPLCYLGLRFRDADGVLLTFRVNPDSTSVGNQLTEERGFVHGEDITYTLDVTKVLDLDVNAIRSVDIAFYRTYIDATTNATPVPVKAIYGAFSNELPILPNER